MKDVDDGRGFNYPMFLSSLGLISSSLASHVFVRAFGWKLHKMDWAFYMKVRWLVGVWWTGPIDRDSTDSGPNLNASHRPLHTRN